MGKNQPLPVLSRRELDIMKILWRLEKASVREVHNELVAETHTAYPTTKTILDRMVVKGYLQRTNSHGIFVYSPLLTKPTGIAKLVQQFVENVLEMDKSAVASLFANSSALNEKELTELQKLINNMKKEKNHGD